MKLEINKLYAYKLEMITHAMSRTQNIPPMYPKKSRDCWDDL